MAKEWYPKVLSYEAGEDFKAGKTVADDDRHRFVKFDADRRVRKLSGASDVPVGVLRDDATTGHTVGVYEEGSHADVYVSGTVAPGDAIAATATGLAIKAATGKLIVGRAAAGGSDGELVQINLVTPTTVAS